MCNYEELLINADSKKTSNPRIYKAFEDFIPLSVLEKKILELEKTLELYNEETSLKLL